LFKRVVRAIEHTAIITRALPNPARRQLLWRMITFCRRLPQQFNHSLPTMMAQLTPSRQIETHRIEPDDVRRLADAVSAWHLGSPLGICLRRSLLRYRFLREAGLPVGIVFGARFKDSSEGGGIGGHAWLTFNDEPYYENPQDYEGFVAMFIYPIGETNSSTSPPKNA
jgi:hypothetical protein